MIENNTMSFFHSHLGAAAAPGSLQGALLPHSYSQPTKKKDGQLLASRLGYIYIVGGKYNGLRC